MAELEEAPVPVGKAMVVEFRMPYGAEEEGEL